MINRCLSFHTLCGYIPILLIAFSNQLFAAPFAYVANFAGNDVSVIDISNKSGGDTVIAKVSVGNGPHSIVLNPVTARAYVTNSYDNDVSVINTANNSETATIPVGKEPRGIAVNSQGTRVYVSNSANDTVSVIDTANNTVIDTVEVESPYAIAVNPAGSKVYVTNSFFNTVSIIDTSTNTVADIVNVGKNPQGITVNPAGTKVYVTNRDSNTVSVIDTATNTLTDTVDVGTAPFGIAINLEGAKAYVTNRDSVSVIDTTNNKVVATALNGKQLQLQGIAINSAGTQAYIATTNKNQVMVVDLVTNTYKTGIDVGTSPSGMAITPINPDLANRSGSSRKSSRTMDTVSGASNAQSLISTSDSISCVFNYFESKYPQYYAPANKTLLTYKNNSYRYYATTDSLLVYSPTDDRLYGGYGYYGYGYYYGYYYLDAGSLTYWKDTIGCDVQKSIPTISLTASPMTVESNGSSTLQWSSTNAASCSSNFSGNTGTSGSQQMSGLTSTQTYTLTCTGNGGSTSKDVTVTVSSKPTTTFMLTSNVVAGTPVQEGKQITFTITPSSIVDKDTVLTVKLTGQAVGGSSTASASDFTAAQPVTFQAGDTSAKTTLITVVDDSTTEGIEGYKASLLDSTFTEKASTTGTITEKPTLTCTAPQVLDVSTNTCVTPMTSGLMAYYPFNGNANDESGNGNNGAVKGASLTSDRLGRANSAYRFSGSSQIIVPHNASLNLTGNNLTLSAWVNLSNPSNDQKIFSKYTWPTRSGYILGVNGGSFNSEVATGPNSNDVVGSPLVANQWTHITVTRTAGGKYRAYTNGQLSSERDALGGDVVSNTMPLRIGVGAFSSTNIAYWAVGMIDEVRIYNRVLSASEIQALASQNDSVTVNPDPLLPTVSLTASPMTADYNGSTTLQWSSTDATSCSSNFSGNTGTSGSKQLSGLTSTQTYTLTCAGNGGSTSKSVTVTVKAKPNTTYTLAQLASQTGVSLDSIQRIRLANATDPFTLPQTKTECIHMASLLGAKWCDGYATFKKVMNCEWYLNVPIGNSMSVSVDVANAQASFNALTKNLVDRIKSEILAAIGETLVQSGVASAIAGIPSGGAAAGPTFVSVFGVSINVTTARHILNVVDWMKTAMAGAQFVNSAFPTLTANNIEQSCGWSEWTRI